MENNLKGQEFIRLIHQSSNISFFDGQDTSLLDLSTGYLGKNTELRKKLIPKYIPISPTLINTFSNMQYLDSNLNIGLNKKSKNLVFSTLPDIKNIITINQGKTAYETLIKQFKNKFISFVPVGENQYGLAFSKLDIKDKKSFIEVYNQIKAIPSLEEKFKKGLELKKEFKTLDKIKGVQRDQKKIDKISDSLQQTKNDFLSLTRKIGFNLSDYNYDFDLIKKNLINRYYNMFQISDIEFDKRSFVRPDSLSLIKSTGAFVERIQTISPEGKIIYSTADVAEIFSRMENLNYSIVNETTETLNYDLIKMVLDNNNATAEDSYFKNIANTFGEVISGQGIMNDSKIGAASDRLYISFEDFEKTIGKEHFEKIIEFSAIKETEAKQGKDSASALSHTFNIEKYREKYKNNFFKISFDPSSKEFTDISVFDAFGNKDEFFTEMSSKYIKNYENDSKLMRSAVMEKVNYHSSRFRHTATLEDLNIYNKELDKVLAINDPKEKMKASVSLAQRVKDDQAAHALDSNGFREFLERNFNSGKQFDNSSSYVQSFYNFYNDRLKDNGYIISDELETLKKYIDNNLNVGVLTGEIYDGMQFNNLLSVAKQTAVIGGKLRVMSQAIFTPLSHIDTDLQRKAQSEDFYKKLILTDIYGEEHDMSNIVRGFFSNFKEYEYKKIAYKYLEGDAILKKAQRSIGIESDSIPNLFQNQAKVIYTETDAAWQDSNMFTKSFAIQNISMKEYKRPISVNYNTIKKETAFLNSNNELYSDEFLNDAFSSINDQIKKHGGSVSFRDIEGLDEFKNNLIKNLLGEANYQTYKHSLDEDIVTAFKNIGAHFVKNKKLTKIEGNEKEYVEASNLMAKSFNAFTNKFLMKADAESSISILNKQAVHSGQNTRIKGASFARISDIRFTKNGIDFVMDQILTQSDGSKVLVDNIKATTQSLTDLIYLQLENGNKIFAEGFVDEKMTKGSRGFSGTYFARDLQTMAMNAIVSPLKNENKYVSDPSNINSRYLYRFNQWKKFMSGDDISAVDSSNKIGTFNIFELFNIDMNLEFENGYPILTFSDKTVSNALREYEKVEGASLDKAIVRGMNQHLQKLFGRTGELNVNEDAFLGNYATDLMFENYEKFLNRIQDGSRDRARVLVKNGSLYKSYFENDTAKFTKINDLKSVNGYTHIWNASIHMMSESKKRATDEALKVGRLAAIVAKEYGFKDLVKIIEDNAVAASEEFLSDYLGLTSVSIKDEDNNVYNFGRGSEHYKNKFGVNSISLKNADISINDYSLSDDYQTYIKNSYIGKLLEPIFDQDKEKLTKPLYGEVTDFNTNFIKGLRTLFNGEDSVYKNINKYTGQALVQTMLNNDIYNFEKNWKLKKYNDQYKKTRVFRHTSDGKEIIFSDSEISSFVKKIKELVPKIDFESKQLGIFDLQYNSYGQMKDANGNLIEFSSYKTGLNKFFKRITSGLSDAIDAEMADNNIKNKFNSYELNRFKSFLNNMYLKEGFTTSSEDLYKTFANFGYHYLTELKDNPSLNSEFINSKYDILINQIQLNKEKILKEVSNFNPSKYLISLLDSNIKNIVRSKIKLPNGKPVILSDASPEIENIFNLLINPNLFKGEHTANFSELFQISQYNSIPFLIDQMSIDENGKIVPNSSLSNIERIMRANGRLDEKEEELNFLTGSYSKIIKDKINTNQKNLFDLIDDYKQKFNLPIIKNKSLENQVNQFAFNYFDLNKIFKKEINNKILIYNYFHLRKNNKIFSKGALNFEIEDLVFNKLNEKISSPYNLTPNMARMLSVDRQYVTKNVREFLSLYTSNKADSLKVIGGINRQLSQLKNSDADQMLYEELSSVKSEIENLIGNRLRKSLDEYYNFGNSIIEFFNKDTIEDSMNFLSERFDSDAYNIIKKSYKDNWLKGDFNDFFHDLFMISPNGYEDVFAKELFKNMSKGFKGEESENYINQLRESITKEIRYLYNLIPGRFNGLAEEIFSKGGRAAELATMKIKNSSAISPREGSIITSFIKEEMIDLIKQRSLSKEAPEELERAYSKLRNDLELIYGRYNVNEILYDYNKLYKGAYNNASKGEEFYLNAIDEIKNKLDNFSHIIVGTEDEYKHVGKYSLFHNKNFDTQTIFGMLSRHPHQYKSSLTPVRYVMFNEENLKSGFISRFYNNGTKMNYAQSSLSFIGKRTALSAKGDFDGDVFQIMFIGDKDLRHSKYLNGASKLEVLKTFKTKLQLFQLMNNLAGDDLEAIFQNEDIMNPKNFNRKAVKYRVLKSYIEKAFNNGETLTGAEAYEKIKLDYLSLTNEKVRVLQMLEDEFQEHSTTPEVFGSFSFTGRKARGRKDYTRNISKKTLSYFMLTTDQDTRRELFFNNKGFDISDLNEAINNNNYLSSAMKKELTDIAELTGGTEFLKDRILDLQNDKKIIRWHLLFNSINKFLDDSGIAKTGMVHNALSNVRETYTTLLDVDNLQKIFDYGSIKSLAGINNAAEYSRLLRAAGMNHDIGNLIEKLAVSAKKGSVDPNKKLKFFADAEGFISQASNNVVFNLRRMAEMVTNLSSGDFSNPFEKGNNKSILNVNKLSSIDFGSENFIRWFSQFHTLDEFDYGDNFAINDNTLKLSRFFLSLSDVNVDKFTDKELSTKTFDELFGAGKLTKQKLSTYLSTWSLVANKGILQKKLGIKEINRNFYDKVIGKLSGANIFSRMKTLAKATLGRNQDNIATRFELEQVIKSDITKFSTANETLDEMSNLEEDYIDAAVFDEDVKEFFMNEEEFNNVDDTEEVAPNKTNQIAQNVDEIISDKTEPEKIVEKTVPANKTQQIVEKSKTPFNLSEEEIDEITKHNRKRKSKSSKKTESEYTYTQTSLDSLINSQSIEESEEIIKARNFYDNYDDAYSDTPLAHSQISVESTNVNKIETEYSDEINSLKNEINSLNTTIEAQKNEIDGLSSKLSDAATSQEEISKANKQADDYKNMLDDAKKEIDELQQIINDKNKIINETGSDANNKVSQLQQQIESLQENVSKLQEKLNKEKEKRKALKNAGEYFDRAQEKFKPIKETIESNPNIAKYKNKAAAAIGIGALALFFRIFQKNRPVVNLDINEQEYERSQGSIYRNLGQYNINTNIRSLY